MLRRAIRRYFQHLEQPAQAFAEIVRVARPGASVVVMDPGWDSLVFDAADKHMTRRIREINSDRRRNGWMGRQLYALAQRSGLTDASATGITAVFTDWQQATLLGFVDTPDEVVSSGAATATEVSDWIRDLQQRAAPGEFFCAMMGFMVAGRKPAHA